MKFERLNNKNEKIEISDHIKAQLKNLGLTLDEIKGREVENPHNREKHKEYRLTLLKK